MNDTDKRNWDRVRRVIEFEMNRGAYIQWADDYAESSYSAEHGIAFADWNPGRWNPSEKAHRILERLGVECEWSDEWTTCGDCYRAVRTQADSYGWVPSFKMTDCEIICKDCLIQDPEEYVSKVLLNQTREADTFRVDLAAMGFEKIKEGENGFHPGQTDIPDAMAEHVPEGKDFVFQIDNVGQFDMSFSLWIRDTDYED